jgi:hypothetical protein
MNGRINQKLIINTIHRNEPTKKAMGVILPRAYKVIEANANTLTNISMIRISGRLIK